MMGLGALGKIGRLGRVGGGGFFPIPGLGNLNNGLYTDFRTGSLVSERGGTWSLARAGATTGVDHEGLVRNLLSGEARFERLRRVANQVSVNSNDLSVASWDKINGATVTGANTVNFGASTLSIVSNDAPIVGGVASKTITVSATVYTASGTAQFRLRNTHGGVADNFSPDLTATTTPQRFSYTVTNSASAGTAVQAGGVCNKTAGGAASVIVEKVQIEDVTGQAITAPSEYVSKGVASSPWHGAGVDGVKYFNTANGNTVASNVVTEATGAALDTTTLKSGLPPWGAHTNIALQSENLGTTWTTIGSPTRSAAALTCGVVSLDLIGDDSAVGLEGYQLAITYTGNATKAHSFYFAKGTATSSMFQLRDNTAMVNTLLGAITWSGATPSITMTTGTLEGIDTLGNNVFRARVISTSVTAANSNLLRIYPATTDVITDVASQGTLYIGGVMAQDATSVFPYIKTTTAAVTVPADVVTLDGTTLINAPEGTLYVMAVGTTVAAASHLLTIDDGTANERVGLRSQAATARYTIMDGGVTQAGETGAAWAAGTTGKAAVRYRLNDVNWAFKGVAGALDTSATMPTTTTFRLGLASLGVDSNTVIQVVAYSRTGATDANLATATTP